jgi:tRNA(Ile)-lysidine synthase
MSIPEKEIDWPALAEALAAGAGLDLWAPEVRAWLGASSRQQVLVACSGGADSVFTLCQLWGLRSELGLEVVVGHYNHGWRGVASDGDAAFVATMARALGCEFLTATRPGEVAGFTETKARTLRMEFLGRAAGESGCGAIIYGHQRDDILETQLQRLARGAGLDGLAAPRPVHHFGENEPVHLRPLLDLSAGQIREYLRGAGIPWREDASNADMKIARNALRGTFIPELEGVLGRDVSAGAARTRRLLEADAAALAALARVALPEAYSGATELSRERVRALPEALARRALTAWLEGHGLLASLSAAGFDGLLAALRGDEVKGRQSVGSRFVVFDSVRIGCESGAAELETLSHFELAVGGLVELSTGAILQSEWVRVDAALRSRLEAGAVDPAVECFAVLPEEAGVLEVRALASGDRYRALGAPGSRKLKDCLLDRGLGKKERKLLPVVSTDGGLVIWVPGLPVSEFCRVEPHAKKALRLTYVAGEAL